MMSKIECLITPGGIIRRTVQEEYVDPREVVAAATANTVTVMGYPLNRLSVLRVKSLPSAAMSQGVVAAQDWVMAWALPYLRFHTLFKLGMDTPTGEPGGEERPVVYPSFTGRDASLNLTWTPPPGLVPILVTGKATNVYLFLLDTSPSLDEAPNIPRTYRLPVGNVFADGRICMGADWPPTYESTKMERECGGPFTMAQKADEVFSRSPWNGDLMSSLGDVTVSDSLWNRARRCFRWTIGPDGQFTQVKVTKERVLEQCLKLGTPVCSEMATYLLNLVDGHPADGRVSA